MKHRNRHNSHSAEIKTHHPQREAGFSYLAPDQIPIVNGIFNIDFINVKEQERR